MAGNGDLHLPGSEALSDEEVVARVLRGETATFEILMRRHNQRLYRASRAILRDDSQAEDVVQDAYVRAYQYLRQYSGPAKFGAWLLRIAVNEALARLRGRKRFEQPSATEESEVDRMDRFASTEPNPEQQASGAEIRKLLEQSIDALPDAQRTVLMLRDVEELSTTETAEALGISEQNVKVRLHRARALLRKNLYAQSSAGKKQAFAFLGPRCDRMVRIVLLAIHRLGQDGQGREKSTLPSGDQTVH
jgi:RNA polymerase sigma-70 factor (ECF subfamily)